MRAPLLGVVGALIALVGLFMAAGTHDSAMFLAGMIFFLYGVILNFWLIGRAVPAHHGEPSAVPLD